MELLTKTPPRTYECGFEVKRTISDCGKISLETDEQVTFITRQGGEYDVTRKDFGFYATPSINGRLRRFGFRTAWARNRLGQDFILLVDNERAFFRYIEEEHMELVRWMGEDAAEICPFCEVSAWEQVWEYAAPPLGETLFSSLADQSYKRRLLRCSKCGHFVSRHSMEIPEMYAGQYVDATYENADGLRKTFQRIMALPPEKSDNRGRVQAVCSFAEEIGLREKRFLDIGSGLGVFPAAMRQAGWDGTALDPDPRAVEMVKELAGVRGICADFLTDSPQERFPVITLNKVLEHVPEPTAMLKAAAAILEPGGFIYLEVPDAAAAWAEGAGREEFFIEHLHIFSAISATCMVTQAGLRLLRLDRLQEPSSKFTLRLFCGLPPKLTPANASCQ